MEVRADGHQLTCCVSGVSAGDFGAARMERWCLRRRRRQSRAEKDYLHSRCCDSDGGAEPPAPPAADRLPRLRICGEIGSAGGEGPGSGRDDAVGPSTGDCADVHLRSRGLSEDYGIAPDGDCGIDGGGGLAEDDSGGYIRDIVVRRTWCRVRERRWCWGGVQGTAVLATLFWLLVLVCGASASIMGDGCDWSGSGLMAEAEVAGDGGGVGVRPVYLRCSQGAVSWAYPRGALRVLLRLAGGEGDFRGCVRVGRTWRGARLFLEGIRALHPLFPDEGEAKGAGVRCFQSRKGQAALYVEATPGGVSPRGRTVASFEYHLQPLPSGVKTFDPSEECRPCTLDEMTHAFCTSDLVTRGTIRSVETHDDPETSELRVRVTKLLRRTRAPPPALEGDHDADEIREEEPQQRGWWSGGDRGASVTLHVPAHCGARHGAGEFVFMAQRKLGQLRLKCAPRLEDWAELARKSNRLATSPCVLQA